MMRNRGRRAGPGSFLWGGIWGSNPRHPEPQSGALPTALIPPSSPGKLRIDPLPPNRRTLAPFAACPLKTKGFALVLYFFFSPSGDISSTQGQSLELAFSLLSRGRSYIKNSHSPFSKSKPSEAGLILGGRRSRGRWSLRGSFRNRGGGMDPASSDVNAYGRCPPRRRRSGAPSCPRPRRRCP